MGLTKAEQIVLLLVTGIIGLGFVVQVRNDAGPSQSVWVKPGSEWQAIPLDEPTSPALAPMRNESASPTRGTTLSPATGQASLSDLDRKASVLDLNRASASELELLPGIGPVKASQIVDYRSAIGGFETPEQLLEVKGIGPRTLDRIRPFLRLERQNSNVSVVRSGIEIRERSSAFSPRAQAPVGILDLNTASAHELESLPGVGPVLAGRILEYRSLHRFGRVDELLEVKGIGPKTLEDLRPRVRAGSAP